VAHLVPATVQAARDALEPFGAGGTAVNLHGHLSAPELAAVAWPEEMRARMGSANAELDPQTSSGTATPLCPALSKQRR
jgi:hypothetical protein